MKLTLLISGFCLFALNVWSQSDNSPYSRFGLGDFNNYQRISSIGMGSLKATFHDAYNSNFDNPASLAYIRAATYEGGLYGKFAQLSVDSASQNIGSGNLSYLALVFPMKNPLTEALEKNPRKYHWSMGLNLSPVSTVNYTINQLRYTPNVDTTESIYTGKGAAYRMVLANAVQYKDLSVGASIGWLFGKYNYSQNLFFIRQSDSYITRTKDDFSIRGFSWQVGVLYDYYMEKKDPKAPQRFRKKLTIGASGHGVQNFTTNKTFLYTRSSTVANSVDTFGISGRNGVEGKGRFPAEWQVGLLYHYSPKFRIGVDYGFSDWSQYRNDAKVDSVLVDFGKQFRVAMGLEYTPNPDDYKYYFKKIKYRLGFYYGLDPRSIDGQNLTDMGISLGFGMPIRLPRQQVSFVNWAIEAGKSGNTNLIEETYIRLHFGFTFNDASWFYKRRFD